MPRVSALLALLVASLGPVLPAAAHAREIEYSAAQGCPSRADVIAKLASDAPNGRSARIDIHPWKTGYRGEVTVGEGEHEVVRTIEARTCAAVVQALALVVALDRDEPEAAASRDDEPTPSPSAESERAKEPAREPDPPAPSRDTPAASPASAEGAGVTFDATVEMRTTSFAGDKLLIGVNPGIEVGSPSGFAGLGRVRLFGRASVLNASALGWAEPSRPARSLDILGGAIDLCVGSPWDTTRFTLGACSRTEIGSLTASAARATSSGARLWTATGAGARARYLVTSTRAAGSQLGFVVEAGAGLLRPLVRDRFHFPMFDEPVTASPLLWTATIAFGLEVR
ncbi:MAG: hypothetical protein KF795_07770 [Labilithrix sp.]|nr:hypothetical protein [Labilithrix sp.]